MDRDRCPAAQENLRRTGNSSRSWPGSRGDMRRPASTSRPQASWPTSWTIGWAATSGTSTSSSRSRWSAR